MIMNTIIKMSQISDKSKIETGSFFGNLIHNLFRLSRESLLNIDMQGFNMLIIDQYQYKYVYLNQIHNINTFLKYLTYI